MPHQPRTGVPCDHWRHRRRSQGMPNSSEFVMEPAFLSALSAQHPLFARLVHSLQVSDRTLMQSAFNHIYAECTDEHWQACFENAVMLSGGRRLTEPFMQAGVNCTLYALGQYLGFAAAADDPVQRGVILTANHCLSVETLMKALSGDAEYGPHGLLPLWKEILPELDFEAVMQSACVPGDIVVYTRETYVVGKTSAAVKDCAPFEVAIHFAVVREIDTTQGAPKIMVASKNGVAAQSPTYYHPLGVMDISMLVSAYVDGAAPALSQPPPKLRVHFFRPPPHKELNAPARLSKLYALACRMENRMEELLLGKQRQGDAAASAGCPPSTSTPQDHVIAPRGRFVKFEGMPCNVSEARARGLRCGPLGVIPP